MTTERLERIGLRILAPVAAVTFAMVVSGIVLLISGNDPLDAFATMFEFGLRRESIYKTMNDAVPLYISGIAFAIAFKMGLFNIGVEGQYTIAIVFAAWAGASVSLPAPLHIVFIMLVAMVVGSMWGAVPGVLKATRGVHEVITTIMMNFIARSVAGYLLVNYFLDRSDETLNVQTERLAESARFPRLTWLVDLLGFPPKAGTELYGFIVVAALIGAAYYVLIWRTRFGYDLRASGLNPIAAQASGVAADGMLVKGMMLSGAVAGLVGIPVLLSVRPFNYGLDFPTGLGFAGITVALLGRNNPFGIAIGAMLIAFLTQSAQILDLEGISQEIVVIMEGVIVLSVVIAYEVVERYSEAREQKRAAEELADAGDGDNGGGAPVEVAA